LTKQADNNLKVILHPNITFKLTEEGEIIVCDFLLKTESMVIDVKKIRFELLDELTGIISAFETESVKNTLKKFSISGLLAEIALQQQGEEIKKDIGTYKEEVYRYAKGIEFYTNVEEKINQDDIRNTLLSIKDRYIQGLKDKLRLKYGTYRLRTTVFYNSKLFNLITFEKKTSCEISFSVSAEWENNIVSLDNFLGLILSNILFSQDKPMPIKYLEYKPIILKINNHIA